MASHGQRAIYIAATENPSFSFYTSISSATGGVPPLHLKDAGMRS